jgi:titin
MALQYPLTRSSRSLAAIGAISLLVASGTASVAHASSATPRVAWFHDPISASARAAEVPVPSKPASYTGAVRHTKATSRTHGGATAVPLSWIAGHALVTPQAVVVPLGGLFGSDNATLTAAGRQAVATLSLSLGRVRALTCEAYGDYAGNAAHVLSLSRARAAAMCGLVRTSNPSVATTSVGFGATTPVVVGGRAADRRANTRIVFAVTKSSSTVSTVITAPKLVSVTAGDRSLGLVFNAPSGAGVYQYQVSLDAGAHWAALDAIGDDPYTALLTGLTNGVQYKVAVRAVTTAGVTTSSNTVLSTPTPPPPGVPVAVNQGIATPGDTTVDVTFWAPTIDGGSPVTHYELSIDGGAWTTLVTSGSNPFTSTVTGLTNGTAYTFVVRAVNDIGPGAPSNARTAIPYTMAGAPTLSSAVRGDSSADITFSAPAFDGGRPVTGYEASTDGGTTWASITTTGTGPFTATLGTLTNGVAYSVAVRAVTVAGPGAASNTMSVTPATTPGAPALSAATGGVQSVDLTFSAPASDGGDAITGYEVSQDNGSTWQPLSALAGTATVTGLADNTSYTFIVHAVNTVGAGPSSGPLSATTATTPDSPTLDSATPGDGQVVLAFSAPTSDGGSAITGYTISDGVTTISATSSPVTFTGLTNGTQYTFSVTATNAVGSSGPSNTIDATPVAVNTLGAPTITSATSYVDAYVHLTFAAPASDGGATITNYEYRLDGGSWVTGYFNPDTSGSNYVYTGCGFGGHSWTVEVRAVNSGGAGPASAPANVTYGYSC